MIEEKKDQKKVVGEDNSENIEEGIIQGKSPVGLEGPLIDLEVIFFIFMYFLTRKIYERTI